MSFYPELDNLSLEELVVRFQGPPPEEEEYAYVYYSEVAFLISQQDELGINYLWQELDKSDTQRLRAILFALTEPPLDHPAITDRLLSYLRDERPEIVAEAIDGLRRRQNKNVLDRVLPLLEHPSPYVRGSVLRFVSNLHPDKSRPLLIEALKDPNFIVRETAADELGEAGMVEALPHLRDLLSDPHAAVRQAAQTAIEMLVGEV